VKYGKKSRLSRRNKLEKHGEMFLEEYQGKLLAKKR